MLVGIVWLTMAGCSGGEYTRRMQETMSSLKTQGERAASVFAKPFSVQDSTGGSTGISLRLPVYVNDKAKILTGTDPDAQPSFAQLPGFAFSYEVALEAELAYVYFASVPVDQKSATDVETEVVAAIGSSFSGASWQDATLERFQGGPITVRRITMVGKQKFGSQVTDGRFDLYLVSSSKSHVLIGWRASDAVAASNGFFDKAAISMGTVQGNT